MQEPTRAQMLLEQVTTGNKLIRRLRAVKAHPLGPVPVKLSNSTKAKIQAFQNKVQQHIDQLTAQREQVAALVAHPEASVDVEHRACGKLESRLAVTVKALVRVPLLQRCDCGEVMHRIRGGEEMFCPACREPLRKADVVTVTLWD